MNIFKEIKDFFRENNEVVSSTENAIKERLSSPFYGYFILSWSLWNWKILYTLFFSSEQIIYDKTGLLKLIFMEQNILHADTLTCFLRYIFYPFFSTLAFFFVFPYITQEIFRKDLKNKQNLKKIKSEQDKKTNALQGEVLDIAIDNIKKEKQKIEEINKIKEIKPEYSWDAEYSNLKESAVHYDLNNLIDFIYSNGGYTQNLLEFKKINKKLLNFAYSNNLITRQGDYVNFTEKGTYFAKKYSEEDIQIPF